MFYDITNTAFMTSDLLYMTSHSLFRTSHHFMYDITSTVSDFTSTVPVSSHPHYWWHHRHYMDGIISSMSVTSYSLIYYIISTKYYITALCVDDTTLGICVTSFALQMTSHPLYHRKPQYLWCHIHFRHDIIPPVSDIAPTVFLSSQTLHWYHTQFWMTSHPLLCDIICTIYNITSNPYLITLLYLWHHNLYIWNHIQYVGQHIHYTWDITANICVLTPTV